MSKINELRAQRAKTWEQTKAFLDSHRSDKGVLSAEDTATYEKMEQLRWSVAFAHCWHLLG